jgi:hypothetical protein
MTDKQPEALDAPHGQVPAIQRFEVVDCIDDKHVPAVIPKPHGPWVRYEDHIAALAAQQPGAAYSALPDEREAFEAMMRSQTFDSLKRLSDGSYESYEARVGWLAWNVRAAHGQAPAGVALPEGWVPLVITHEGQYPEEIAYGPQRMMDRLGKWLRKYFDSAVAAKAHPAPAAVAGPSGYGPKVTVKRRCSDCKACNSESYAVQGDSGHYVYCEHPSLPERKYIGDTHWDTPDWCPAAAPTTQPAPQLPERDASVPAEQQGLFRKFDVRRVDGSDKPGGKHHGCTYFVLDVDHDPCARPALAAYAAACEATHPALAADLLTKWGAAPTTQPAPQQDVLAAGGDSFLLLPTRPTPDAPANTAGLSWDAYSGAQMLAYGRSCSDAALVVAAPQQGPSQTAVQLAEMVLSDCGHSSNYTPLLNRVAARIDAHVERCLESKKTAQQEAQSALFDEQGFREWVSYNLPYDTIIGNSAYWADHLSKGIQRFVKAAPQQEPAGWFDDDRVFWHEGKQPAQGSDLYTTPPPRLRG